MARRFWTSVFLLTLIAHDMSAAEVPPSSKAILTSATSPAAAGALTGAESAVTGPELMRKMLSNEVQLDAIPSLYLRFHSTTSHRPLMTTLGGASPVATKSKTAKSAPRIPDIKPGKSEEIEIAIDDHRLRVQVQMPGEYIHTHVWDGQRATSQLQSMPLHEERYIVAPNPFRLMTEQVWVHPSLPRMIPQMRWTIYPNATVEKLEKLLGISPFQVVEQRQYRGRLCYVVENRPLTRRYFFDADDLTLRGFVQLDFRPRFEQIARAKKLYGDKFPLGIEYSEWRKKLSGIEREALKAKEEEVRRLATRPAFETYYEDYRELAPGVMFPAKQTFVTYQNDSSEPTEPVVIAVRKHELVETKVNQSLPDTLFEIKPAKGATVEDYAYDPPLIYHQDKTRTSSQWKAMLKQNEQQNASLLKSQQERKALVGHGAPAFPMGTWINSKPTSLAALTGKPVLLYFWDSMTPGGSDDVDTLNTMYRLNDFAVIGVHAAEYDIAEVRWALRDDGVRFPVLVVPDIVEMNPLGELFGAYHIPATPLAVVLDREGTVMMSGPLAEAVAKANELLQPKPQRKKN